MEYPKKVMKMNEMKKLGFSEEMLLRAALEKGQTFAWKMNPVCRTSTILFDTDEFEKWRKKQARATQQSMASLCNL